MSNATSLVQTPTSPVGNVVPCIFWGGSQDLSYNGSSGASVRIGPLTGYTIRLALATTGGVRIAIGNSSVVATATGDTLFVGPGVEFVGITSGDYLAAISNDSTTGILNVTVAL